MAGLGTRLTLALRAVMGQFDAIMPQTAGGLLQGLTQTNPPARNAAAYLDAYSTMPWLRATTQRIADSVAAVRWQAFAVRRGGRFQRMADLATEEPVMRRKLLQEYKQSGELVPIEDTPLLRVLYQANPLMTGGGVRKLTQIYLDIVGEAFWLKERLNGRVVERVWPLAPTWIRTTPTPTSPVYELSVQGFQATIPATEILWFKHMNPVNPYGRGSGIAQAVADELDIDEYAAKYTKAWFYNSAIPPVVVAPDGDKEWSDSARQQMKASWLHEHQGFWKSFKVMFSRSSLKLHELTHTFQEQQLGQLRQQERDIILQVLGIPPELLGILTNSNRATIEGADYLYAKYVLTPRLEHLREMLQSWLVPEYDDRILLEYENPVPEDKEHRLNVAKAQPQALTQNEWRGLAGFEPTDDGDVHHLPLTVMPQASLSDMPMMPASAQPPPAERRALESGTLKAPLKAPLFVDDAPADEFYLLVHQVADRLMPRFQRRWLEIVQDAKATLDINALETALRGGLMSAVEDVIPWAQIVEAWRQAASATFQQAVTSAGTLAAEELSAQLAVSVSFGTASPRVAEFAASHAAAFVVQIDGPTREAIRQAVSRAFLESRTSAQVAREIRDTLGLLPRQELAVARFRAALLEQGRSAEEAAQRAQKLADAYLRQRAQLIARTELIDAASEGQQQAWLQAADEGFLDREQARRFWVITPDDRLDLHICEPIPTLNPDGVGLTEPFQTPAGLKMRPTAHPGCRCAVTLRLGGAI